MLDFIKKIFSVQKFEASATLIDGTELIVNGTIDTIGAEIFVSTPDGKTPIPDGDYTLKTGEMITCKDGKLEKITQATTDPEVDVEVENSTEVDNGVTPTDQPVEDPSVTKESNTETDQKISDLETKVSDLTSMIDEIKSKLKLQSEKELEFQSEIMLKFEKMDGAKPLKKNDTDSTDTFIKDPVARYIFETRNKK